MDIDVFEALVGNDPRILAMLQWRIALGELTSTEEVANCFREDWNKVEDVYKRVAHPSKTNDGGRNGDSD